MNKWGITIFLLIVAPLCSATEKPSTQPTSVEDAPKVKPGNVLRSEITITESNDALIKEYRVAGKLRAIKVMPKNGMPVYYLIDREGNGEFVKLGPDMGPEMKVPQWILFEW